MPADFPGIFFGNLPPLLSSECLLIQLQILDRTLLQTFWDRQQDF